MMDAVTYGGARTPTNSAGESVRTKRRKSFRARVVHALNESRQKEARRVIEKYRHLLRPEDS